MTRTKHKIKANLQNIPCVECLYTVPTKRERAAVESAFRNVRKAFVKFLAQTQVEALRQAGVSEKEIKIMAETGRGPSGFTVHHKLPRHGGGTNDFSNLCLTATNVHVQIHRDLEQRVRDKLGKAICDMEVGESCLLEMPFPEGMICTASPCRPRSLPENGPALRV